MPNSQRWTPQQAWEWWNAQPWPCGFNYVPRYAVNSAAIWQADTFDVHGIEWELRLAADIGFNACRVFLPYIVWEADADGFIARMEAFLDICAGHGISVMPVLFDECAFAILEPYLGPQNAPAPGIHNSGWTPSPGHARAQDKAAWPGLERYVRELVGHFARDKHILAWDVYNEPGNSGMGAKTLPLLEAAFRWARQAQPAQPITAGVWTPALPEHNALMLARSDIVTFHDYDPLPKFLETVARLRAHERPLLCTEWMRRGFGSHFDTHFPYMQQERIGSYFWGLINGRTQTHLPWGSTADCAPPAIWFHDLLRSDGTAYDPQEIAQIQALLASPEIGS